MRQKGLSSGPDRVEYAGILKVALLSGRFALEKWQKML